MAIPWGSQSQPPAGAADDVARTHLGVVEDRDEVASLKGIWTRFEPGTTGDPVRFYYFHGDGNGLYFGGAGPCIGFALRCRDEEERALISRRRERTLQGCARGGSSW